MVNRDPSITDKQIGAPFTALATFPAEAWEEADLPERIKSRPVNTSVGHGKKYLQQKGM
jgi:hypothetical protein